jgi:NAD(P)H-dependent flavin oxidoreductase YrpB (nitropropane dioxygenase family)
MDLFSCFPSSINYKTNQEYRNWIRRIFHFTKDAKTYYANLKENDFETNIDEESKDEMDYDYDSMKIGLDIILEKTINETIFKEMYTFAAAAMFSTDVKVGQVVLCSYDYFHLYFTCLWFFFLEKDTKIESLASYQDLMARLKK